MQSLFDKHAKRYSIDSKALRFLLDGDHVKGSGTCGDLIAAFGLDPADLKNKDELNALLQFDCMKEMMGG